MRYILPILTIVLFSCSDSKEVLKEEGDQKSQGQKERVDQLKKDVGAATEQLSKVELPDSVFTDSTEFLVKKVDSTHKELAENTRKFKNQIEKKKTEEELEAEEHYKSAFKSSEEEILIAEEPEEDISKTQEDIWNELLEFVSDEGRVRYMDMKTQRKSDLDEYLRLMDSQGPEPGEVFPLSYYLNLYNAATIKQLVDNYPVRSMKEIPNAWEGKVVSIKGVKYSLNELENDLIRKQFKNPLVHFGLNCGANSCPKLLNRPFIGNAEDQLVKLTKEFLNDNYKGVRIEGKKVYISKIFDWYVEDFGGKTNLLKWIGEQIGKDLSGFELADFIEYDWSVNKDI